MRVIKKFLDPDLNVSLPRGIIALFLCTIAFTQTLALTTRLGRTYVNPTGSEFPILAYHAFEPDMINETNYRILRECGINMANGWCEDTTYVSKSLQIANEAGIKLLINIPQTRNPKLLPGIVKRYDIYPATAGYLLADEPVLKEFEAMKSLINAVLDHSDKLAYINLLPNYAPKDSYGTKDYREYLEKFIETANPQFLSYDNYCIMEKASGVRFIRPDYFANLEVAREVSLKYEMPLWTFCLSTAHFSYPVPTLGELLFEAFNGLAYGSKAIQYYGYATKKIGNVITPESPVSPNGKRRKAWYAMQKANTQIQLVGQLLLPCESVNVWHTGSDLPTGTHRLHNSDLPGPFISLVSESKGVVVSHLKNGNTNYLLIVNKDFENSQTIRLQKSQSVERITEKGKRVMHRGTNTTLKPGSWLLYTW